MIRASHLAGEFLCGNPQGNAQAKTPIKNISPPLMCIGNYRLYYKAPAGRHLCSMREAQRSKPQRGGICKDLNPVNPGSDN